jgi:dimethylargininase
MPFKNAIVRPPCANFADGLTTSSLGVPSYDYALRQHESYCEALIACGLDLTRLAAENEYPDSTFVEDTAIVTEQFAVITRPGAESRVGEIEEIAKCLSSTFTAVHEIQAPGTLDGGDICEADSHFFIGISDRTNKAGATQLARIVEKYDYTASFIDIRNTPGILHLKSGVSYLGDGNLAAIASLAEHPAFNRFEILGVDADEEYAANCVRVNDAVLVAAGFPKFEELLNTHGYRTVELDMSEFEKMDGGLSCLSLRY